MVDGRFSNVVVAGCWCALASFVLIVLSFSTPCWLESDGQLADSRFVRLGLWTICFDKFRDPLNFYDFEFSGCRWVLNEEYRIIDDVVRPRFFVMVQLFFTLCMLASVCSCAITSCYVFCVTQQYEVVVLKIVWLSQLLTGVLGSVSVLVFAVYGDGRDWMPDYLHNNLSWSFALGVTGVVLAYFGAVFFWVQARRENKLTSRAITNKLPVYEPSSQV